MNYSAAKAQIEADITNRFGPIFKIGEKPAADYLSSGLVEIDRLTGGGLPRGAITEIVGPMSGGRMSLLIASLAYATTAGETCAVVDTSDSFDPRCAAHAGVDLSRMLWIRCGNSVERGFKATDLLLQSGGFGFVALNLADVAVNYARRIVSSWWFRFRRAIENTPTAFMVISPVDCVRSCASIVFEAAKINTLWRRAASAPVAYLNQVVMNSRRISIGNTRRSKDSSSPHHSKLLTEVDVRVKLLKPNTWATGTVNFDMPGQRPI